MKTAVNYKNKQYRIARLLIACLSVFLSFGSFSAGARVERHSNGLGGGRWSDASTWHDGTVPLEHDHVIITGGDTVVFDAGVGDGPNCAALSVDPGGVLTFRLDDQRHRLTVAGPVESYGAIRLDAVRDPGTRAALVLSAEQDVDRAIRLFRGSSLLLYGAPPRADGAPNLELIAAPGGTIEASGDVMLDLHNVRISGIHVRATDIDNTGYRPLQRLNLVNNRFEGGAHVSLERCDTALVRGNRFLYTGDAPLGAAAVFLNECSLTACGDNYIRGYLQGIMTRNDVDAAVQGNTVRGAQTGILMRGGRNCMIKGNQLFDCETGLNIDGSSGVVESLRVENCGRGIVLRRATLQLTDVTIASAPEDAAPLTLDEATAILLNCNISAEEITIEGNRPHGEFWARSMNYLVVRVTGKVPPRAVVHVQTAEVSGGVPDKAADLNVRNVPARLSEAGFTPFPRSLRPIVLRSWEIDVNKKLRDPPFYDLAVMPIVEAADQTPKALHKQVIEPGDNWFRSEPDAPEPTLEIKIP